MYMLHWILYSSYTDSTNNGGVNFVLETVGTRNLLFSSFILITGSTIRFIHWLRLYHQLQNDMVLYVLRIYLIHILKNILYFSWIKEPQEKSRNIKAYFHVSLFLNIVKDTEIKTICYPFACILLSPNKI